MMRTTAILVAVAMLAAVVPATEADPLNDLGVMERYLVGFHGYPDFAAGEVYHSGLIVEVNNPLKYILVETATPAYLKQQALQDDRVRYVQWDSTDWELHYTPNDPLHTHDALWGTHRVGAPAAWDVTTGSTAIKVAHLDSGLNKNHEEFAGQSRVLQGYDFRNNDNDPEDVSTCDWHGTHTTGTAGATMDNGKGFAGLSQHTILPVKIFAGGFFGCGTTTSALTNALQYAGDQGAHLSSNSWGGGASDTAINDAIQYAHGKGTIHVASAGNGGCTNCVGQPWVDNPAITIIVSSSDSTDGLSDFSSTGPEVDIIAPGSDVGSSTSGTADYHYMSGTSMAAPHVTGSLALYMAAHGKTDYNSVESALKSTAEDLGLSSSQQGAGLVRADLLAAGGSGGGGGGGNNAPTASFTYTCTDLACDFDGTGSSDPDGDALTYSWDFGDGNTGSGATVSHTYGADGTYTVTLTVSDGSATDSTSQSVSVSGGGGGGDPISLDANGYKVKGRHHIDLTWSGATSTDVDVYRDGSLLTTTANDGFYTDATNNRGGASYTYQVCEAGTTTCSNQATVVF